jgi:hypothetical protein
MNFWKTLKSKQNLVTLATIFGIVISSVCTFAAVQLCWLTPDERDAARSALTAIDNLQNSGLVDGDDAAAQTKQAEDAVETARQAARTSRDQDVAFALIQYLGSIETERQTVQSQGLTQERIADPAVHLSAAASSRSLSLKLHETLD